MKTDEQRAKNKNNSGVIGGVCFLSLFVALWLYGIWNLVSWILRHAIQFVGHLLGN